jgi:hypothetical protein
MPEAGGEYRFEFPGSRLKSHGAAALIGLAPVDSFAAGRSLMACINLSNFARRASDWAFPFSSRCVLRAQRTRLGSPLASASSIAARRPLQFR